MASSRERVPAATQRSSVAVIPPVLEHGSRIGRSRQVSGGRLLESRLALAEVAQW
jgi:hypothetical protein